MNNQIIIVDDQDNAIGYGEKMEVHQKERLNRRKLIQMPKSKF